VRCAPRRLLVFGVALALLLAGCATESGLHRDSGSRPRPAATANVAKPSYGEIYTVTKGDTLYSIAFRNGLDYHDLADWNGIGRDYTIHLGQRLRLTAPGSPLAPPASTGSVQASAPPVAGVAAGGVAPSGGEWEWPTRGKVIRSFEADGSKGIDIGGEPGQLIVASRGGRVVYSGAALKGYGELIIVKHDEQYLSAYGYNRKRLVEEGETVGAGQPIAELGIGPEQKPLLHFEVRDRGRPVDPSGLLPRR
jgi:lipoprotein NlpD